MVAARMKLALLCLYFLHLAFVSAGLLNRSDRQNAQSSVSAASSAPNQHSSGSVTLSRPRTLFARRGQYRRQRVLPPKPKVVPVPPKDTKPAKPNCSGLTQSCLPQSGCCDLSATCHCRFFNAICFCRKTSS